MAQRFQNFHNFGIRHRTIAQYISIQYILVNSNEHIFGLVLSVYTRSADPTSFHPQKSYNDVSFDSTIILNTEFY